MIYSLSLSSFNVIKILKILLILTMSRRDGNIEGEIYNYIKATDSWPIKYWLIQFFLVTKLKDD